MKIFVIRARKGSVSPERIHSQVGGPAHPEVLAHTLMNAFYISAGMRRDVEVYIVLDASPDFPKTIRFSSVEALSFSGFHEAAFLDKIAEALQKGGQVRKDESLPVDVGVTLYGFGFEKLIKQLQAQCSWPIYLLDPKGEAIDKAVMPQDAIFLLSDHLALPPNTVKGLLRWGVKKLSVGKKMLFAAQCVTLIHHFYDKEG